jgi:uncharacterized protein (TIGR02145 family)
MITISGTPTEVGTFAYNIALTGGCLNATGTITVEAPFTCGTSTVTFTYNGASVTYGTLSSSVNGGPCFMDRNLGASQEAGNSTDYLAYGDLFQWGRADDGHQVINWTSSSASDGAEQTNESTGPSSSPSPGSTFLLSGSVTAYRYNWYNGSNPNYLWLVDGTGVNNPCPSGWRVPTESEWLAESSASATGFSKYGHLKLPMAGRRLNTTGSLSSVGASGRYWSSTHNSYKYSLFLDINYVTTWMHDKNYGYSVRCLKD